MANNMKAWAKRYDETYFCYYAILFGDDPSLPDSIHGCFQPRHWEIISSIRLKPGGGPVLLKPESLEVLTMHGRYGEYSFTKCGLLVDDSAVGPEDVTRDRADVTCSACLAGSGDGR